MTTTISNENLLRKFLRVLAEDYNNGSFVPLLESDVVSYLYMLWVSEKRDARNVHVSTRLCDREHEKYDFVIGNVDPTCDARPCIAHAELVIEAKVFLMGFKGGQLSRRYMAVKKDIEKLARLHKIAGERRILLFDGQNYLDKLDKESRLLRIEAIVKKREEEDRQIKIACVKELEGRVAVQWY